MRRLGAHPGRHAPVGRDRRAAAPRRQPLHRGGGAAARALRPPHRSRGRQRRGPWPPASPGRHGPADRPRQSPRLPGAPGAGGGSRAPVRTAALARPGRPGPLQAGQRRSRPPGGRRGAGRGGQPPAGVGAHGRPHGPGGRRGVRVAPARHRRGRGRVAGRARAPERGGAALPDGRRPHRFPRGGRAGGGRRRTDTLPQRRPRPHLDEGQRTQPMRAPLRPSWRGG